jgi:tRNA pseudouridine55 synthase
MQQPPAYSAKKIGGQPSYKLARRADRRRDDNDSSKPACDPLAARLSPAAVATSALEIVDITGDCVTLRVDCSAGFYVRALAHDLGDRLGTGAHLLSLRRLRSGAATLADALPLDALESDGGRERAAAALIPLSQMLPDLPAIVLTENGVQHAGHGRLLASADFVNANPVNPVNPVLRLLDQSGNLVGLARPSQTTGLLHPFVVLM